MRDASGSAPHESILTAAGPMWPLRKKRYVRSAEYHVPAWVAERTVIRTVGPCVATRVEVEAPDAMLRYGLRAAARCAGCAREGVGRAAPVARPEQRRAFLTTSAQWLSTRAPDAATLPSAKPAFALRPYQIECVETCLEAIGNGAKRIGVSSPTGSGKTTMFTELLARIPSEKGRSQALILVNAVALAEQASETVERMLPHLRVEIEQGAKYRASGTADVTVATVQSLKNASRLEKYDPWKFKCVIVDEAHHSTSATYRTVLSHFNSDIPCDEPEIDVPVRVPIIGFSATFSRHDGLALGTVFDQIVFHKDFLAMIEEQW